MEMDLPNTEFERGVGHLAQTFPFPVTPDIARKVIPQLRGGRSRLRSRSTPAWGWGIALIILVFVGLMAVPSVRAAVLEFIQVGAIRIFLQETPTPIITPTPLPGFASNISTATPNGSGSLSTVSQLFGEASLAEAQEKAEVPILLPAYPKDLGVPDKVFFQELNGGWGIIVIWFDTDDPEKIRLSLLVLGPGTFAGKGTPGTLVDTSVNGIPALWMEGDHWLLLQTGSDEVELFQLLVKGNVLVWEVGKLTYRLESEFSMEETLQIAESMR